MPALGSAFGLPNQGNRPGLPNMGNGPVLWLWVASTHTHAHDARTFTHGCMRFAFAFVCYHSVVVVLRPGLVPNMI